MRREIKLVFIIILLCSYIGFTIHTQPGTMFSITASDNVEVDLSKIPTRFPNPSQQDLNLAVELFSIQNPNNYRIKFNKDLLDRRGEATLSTNRGQPCTVAVGPYAFESWGILGATVAHEVEVHCNQNLLKILIMNLLGLKGTVNAEIEAYQYELDSAKRFGLTETELSEIRTIRDLYINGEYDDE